MKVCPSRAVAEIFLQQITNGMPPKKKVSHSVPVSQSQGGRKQFIHLPDFPRCQWDVPSCTPFEHERNEKFFANSWTQKRSSFLVFIPKSRSFSDCCQNVEWSFKFIPTRCLNQYQSSSNHLNHLFDKEHLNQLSLDLLDHLQSQTHPSAP